MKNKTLLLIPIAVIVIIGGYFFYQQSKPKRTSCEILVGNILDAKTQAEENFARERWQVLCDKDKP